MILSFRFSFIQYFVLVLMAMTASYFIPPIQSPDENQHFARAYMLSKGDFLLETIPGKMSGGYIDDGLHEFIKGNLQISGQSDKKLSTEEKIKLKNLRWSKSGEKTFMEIPGTGFYFPLIYLPHAIPIKIGEISNISIYQTYLLTRFFLISISIALMMWAFSMVSPSVATLNVLMLPMSMFQLLSPTLDGLTTSLSLVSIAIFYNFSSRPHAAKSFYILMGSAILVASTRIHLLPIIIFLFMASYYSRSKNFLALSIASLISTLLWVAFSIKITVDNRIPRDFSTFEIIQHYIFHPFDFLGVFFNTITNPEMLAFYQQSFIGKLGWLDTLLPAWHYSWLFTFIILFFIAGIFSENLSKPHLSTRVTILVVAFSSMLAIFAALLVSWTPHPATIINGIQGRYFTVPVLLLAYATHGIFPCKSKKFDFSIKSLLILFFLFSIYSMLSALQERFTIF